MALAPIPSSGNISLTFFLHIISEFLSLISMAAEKSSNPNVKHTSDLFIIQFYELLKSLRLLKRSFTLIGHSFGGAVAVLFAERYPTMISKLVLIAPAGIPWQLPLGASILTFPILGKQIMKAMLSLHDNDDVYNNEHISKEVKEYIEKKKEIKLIKTF